ncbi:MAG: conjugal transfer protein TraX [Defluviitaleaceae bacterium]|nr:conjugal transfer protein TraX [Defluviitaleaceae bacterium]
MSSFILKIAALSTMIIDHIGFAFIISSFRYIGRIAFPLYAFLIGEGCRHTSNIKRYLGRLLVFAFISEIPFDLLRSTRGGVPIKSFTDIIDMSAQNVFFTLFFGALSIAVYLHVKKAKGESFALIIGLSAMIICAYLADFIRADYGFMGVIIIALPAIAAESCPLKDWKKFINIAVIAICLLFIYNVDWQLGFLLASFVSLIFILIYNGRKGMPVKWAFYLTYPLHMAILFLIWFYLGNI